MSYTDDMKELIVTEYEAGTSIADIAKMTDKRYQSIRSAVRSKWYEELKAQLVESEVENESDEPDVLEEPVEDTPAEASEVDEVNEVDDNESEVDPNEEVDPHNENDQDELESDFDNEEDDVDNEDEPEEEYEEEVNKMHWGNNDDEVEPYQLPPDVDVDIDTFESLGFVMDEVEEEEVEEEVEEEGIDSTPPF